MISRIEWIRIAEVICAKHDLEGADTRARLPMLMEKAYRAGAAGVFDMETMNEFLIDYNASMVRGDLPKAKA